MRRSVIAVMAAVFAVSVTCATQAAPAKRRGIAIPSDRKVVTSNPPGTPWTWEPIAEFDAVDPRELIRSIECSADAGVAITTRGRVLVSQDGGNSWEIAPAPTPPPDGDDDRPWTCCKTVGETLVLGGYQTMAVSFNGGRTWSTPRVTGLPDELNNTEWTVRDIAANPRDSDDLIAVGGLPRVRRTEIREGTEWVDGRREDVTVEVTVTVRPDVPVVIRSDNGGRTWRAAIQPGRLAVGQACGVHYDPGAMSWVFGLPAALSLLPEERRGHVLNSTCYSDDGGRTWEAPSEADGSTPLYTWPMTKLKVDAQGLSMWVTGAIHAWWTVDGGETWNATENVELYSPGAWQFQEDDGEMGAIHDASLITPAVGVAVAEGKLYHSSNTDVASPRWINDTIEGGFFAYTTAACEGGRYPAVATGYARSRDGTVLAILGLVPPANTIIRSRTIEMAEPMIRPSLTEPPGGRKIKRVR